MPKSRVRHNRKLPKSKYSNNKPKSTKRVTIEIPEGEQITIPAAYRKDGTLMREKYKKTHKIITLHTY